jgi:hypothetical protein
MVEMIAADMDRARIEFLPSGALDDESIDSLAEIQAKELEFAETYLQCGGEELMSIRDKVSIEMQEEMLETFLFVSQETGSG